MEKLLAAVQDLEGHRVGHVLLSSLCPVSVYGDSFQRSVFVNSRNSHFPLNGTYGFPYGSRVERLPDRAR